MSTLGRRPVVKSELICFGGALGMGGKPQNFPKDLESKASPIPWWSGLPIRIGLICLAKYKLSICTASVVLLTHRAREVLRLGGTSKAHPSTKFLAICKPDVGAAHPLLQATERYPTRCLQKVEKHPSMDRRSVWNQEVHQCREGANPSQDLS